MKYILLVALSLLLVTTACKSTRQASEGSEEVQNTERDGSSYQKAIKVKSIGEEYAWIKKNYPNSQPVGQALLQKGGKHYDKITVKLTDGTEKDFYFDINSFFGKF